MTRCSPGRTVPLVLLTLLVLTLPSALTGATTRLAAADPIDWIASDAFGDIAARAGWRPVTDVSFAKDGTATVVPGAGVLFDPTGDARHLYTIDTHGDLEVSGEFLLAPGSTATLGLLARYDVRFGPRASSEGLAVGDPGTILGAEPGTGIPPRIGIPCAPGTWHRFSVTLRAPRFDARGVRTAPARFVRVVLDGVVLQVDVDVPAPSAGAPDFELTRGPFALRSGGGPVAYRHLVARELSPDRGPTAPDPFPVGRVVVFTRTTGFRHPSITAGIETFLRLGRQFGFPVVPTEDPSALVRHLDGTDVVVFLNTTGDILDEAQQAAFESYVRGGGGVVGIHSAADTEYEWPFYGRMMGAYFSGHPAVQEATVQVVDRAHPATAMLPATWPRTDEWYNYRARPAEDVRILATLDVESYEGSDMGAGHPIVWCHAFGGGRVIYTGGGHTKSSFEEPFFRAHLLGAMRWAAGDDRIDDTVPSFDAPATPEADAPSPTETDGDETDD